MFNCSHDNLLAIHPFRNYYNLFIIKILFKWFFFQICNMFVQTLKSKIKIIFEKCLNFSIRREIYII